MSLKNVFVIEDAKGMCRCLEDLTSHYFFRNSGPGYLLESTTSPLLCMVVWATIFLEWDSRVIQLSTSGTGTKARISANSSTFVV